MEAEGGALKAGPIPPEKGAKYNSRCRAGTLIRSVEVGELGSVRLSPRPSWAYSYRQTLS